MEVEAIKPDTPKMRDSLQSMKDCGVKYLYGRWLIEGGPQVLLFDTGSMMSCLDKWKTNLWNLAGIPAPPKNSETNNAIVFGYLVAWFLGAHQGKGAGMFPQPVFNKPIHALNSSPPPQSASWDAYTDLQSPFACFAPRTTTWSYAQPSDQGPGLPKEGLNLHARALAPPKLKSQLCLCRQRQDRQAPLLHKIPSQPLTATTTA
ncbi:hypothetical protein PtA15_15A353 [Puccinia triticina]|uniref:Glycogen [starch] synthase n=1 Tax=Puccinia triticina TaxID=208348 RepID=A0ABY7D3Z5_9BASI|nr:uncharacterized protein PtA15_15A353 [Puccinia triticina]WAQ91960.1 hypothetical protein PtA15_15A353 [Puccinia triticina]